MAEVTTNFRDSSQGDLGKNLVSREYLQAVYPKLYSNLFIGTIRSYPRGPSILYDEPAFSNAPSSNWKYVETSDKISSIQAYQGTVAIREDGTVWFKGEYPNNGTFRSTPTQLLGNSERWKKFTVGNYNFAGIKEDGTLWCIGPTNDGVKSVGSTTISGFTIEYTSSTNWKTVSINKETTGRTPIAAIKTDGSLWTWGENIFYTLGREDFVPFLSITARGECTSLQGREYTNSTWKSVRVNSSVVAIKTDGSLWTWGLNNGLAGIRCINKISTPALMTYGNSNWKTIPSVWTPSDFPTMSIWNSSLFLKNDGTLWGWGHTNNGAIPTGNFDPRKPHSPKREISGSTNWKQVVVHNDSLGYGFGLKTDGTIWRWGYNYNSYQGTGSGYTAIASPMQVISGGSATTWKFISCAKNSSSYNNKLAAIRSDNTLWFMGGSLLVFPSRYRGTSGTAVQEVSLSTDWESISFGSDCVSAIKTNGTLWSIGDNSSGQHGSNVAPTLVNNQTLPVQEFTSSTNWKQVSCGHSSVHAVKDDGTLWSWGSNTNGQLATNDKITRSTPVQEWTSSTNWKMVAAGGGFSAGFVSAIKTDGTLWSWGYNNSCQLGTNDSITRSTPTQEFTSSTNWNYVCCGETHIAAIKNDGTLWSWGGNEYSQTGIESGFYLITPVRESTQSKWIDIDISHYTNGAGYFIGIKDNGTLWASNFSPYSPANSSITTPMFQLSSDFSWKQCSTSSNNIGSKFQALRTDGTLLFDDSRNLIYAYLAKGGGQTNFTAIEAI